MGNVFYIRRDPRVWQATNVQGNQESVAPAKGSGASRVDIPIPFPLFISTYLKSLVLPSTIDCPFISASIEPCKLYVVNRRKCGKNFLLLSRAIFYFFRLRQAIQCVGRISGGAEVIIYRNIGT